MLLTSSQISMTISSSIVFVFTSLLFLSGYILQQQTVHNLQAALNPTKASRTINKTTTPSASSSAVASLAFGDRPASSKTRDRVAYQEYLSAPSSSSGKGRQRSRNAYVQLVTETVKLCNAVILFAELHRAGDSADRVLMYPKAWDGAAEGDDEASTSTSRRLLEVAAKEYNVLLEPVEPVLEDAKPTSTSYPLFLLLSMTRYDRLIYLPPSGILLNSDLLTSLFDTPLDTTIASLPPIPSQEDDAAHRLLLVRPSKAEYTRSAHRLRTNPTLSNSDLLNPYLLQDPTSSISLLPITADPETQYDLVLQTSALNHLSHSLNASTVLASTAYIHISDPGLPGPEYDIPRGSFLEARPGDGEARRVWEYAYERFREERMGVCGLDLEPWRAGEGSE